MQNYRQMIDISLISNRHDTIPVISLSPTRRYISW